MSTLHVSALPDGIDDETFRSLFEGYADIVSSECDPSTKSGTMTFGSSEDATYVKNQMDGFELCGTVIKVIFATEARGGGRGKQKAKAKAQPKAWWEGDASQGDANQGDDSGANWWEEIENERQGLQALADGNADEGDANAWWEGNTGKSDASAWWQDNAGGADPLKPWAPNKGGSSIKPWAPDTSGGSGWGGGKSSGRKTWTPQPATEELEPTDNLYIKGLPVEFTKDLCEEIFGGYGTIQQCKLMNYATDTCALIRMSSIDEASEMVSALNGNIPPGLETAISVRFADTPVTKAKKMQASMSAALGVIAPDDTYGPAKGGKGKGKDGPYGFAGQVQYGNFDPTLPPEISPMVDTVMLNMGGKVGGKGKRRIAHDGDESNLYVKDLPGTADELYIYKLFSPFGALESIWIKKGDDGSWAIAFVKFMNNDGAANAVIGLTNCLLPDGTMPKVSIKTRKDSAGP
mmetsp:Transcript_94800/g.182186  ORF Transcript_94800/g.182186 Transcript_94800/m.182186 type:complete len:463 (-) Transcript_94800:112-1500(-)